MSFMLKFTLKEMMQMLLPLRELLGYTIRTIEKDVGIVEDILFSDDTWRIKYAAVRLTSGY